jgi:hypothetical protein
MCSVETAPHIKAVVVGKGADFANGNTSTDGSPLMHQVQYVAGSCSVKQSPDMTGVLCCLGNVGVLCGGSQPVDANSPSCPWWLQSSAGFGAAVLTSCVPHQLQCCHHVCHITSAAPFSASSWVQRTSILARVSCIHCDSSTHFVAANLGLAVHSLHWLIPWRLTPLTAVLLTSCSRQSRERSPNNWLLLVWACRTLTAPQSTG